MTLLEAIQERHTVRNYAGKALEGEVLAALQAKIAEINEKTGLHLQLINGKENAFGDYTIRYGIWKNVTNYIALVGKKSDKLHETVGYYGEQLVLWAQTVGLKTGWVETGYTVKPEAIDVAEDEELVLSIAIGESELTGAKHKVKAIDELCTVTGEAPEWFVKGMEATQLAPTAGNQQLFHINWDGENLTMTTKPGFLEKVDLGVVKYHFEIGAGIDHSMWK